MKPSSRGKGLCIELAINIFGVMLSYWVDYGMSFVENDAQFRFPLALQIAFALSTLFGILVLPESPRWLIAHDRQDEARQILWAVQPNAQAVDINDSRLNESLNEIQRAIEEEREAAAGGSYKALIKNGAQRFRYRTLLGIGGQFMQQISGINLITYVRTSPLWYVLHELTRSSMRRSSSSNPWDFHTTPPFCWLGSMVLLTSCPP